MPFELFYEGKDTEPMIYDGWTTVLYMNRYLLVNIDSLPQDNGMTANIVV